jgi:hypothetical protein
MNRVKKKNDRLEFLALSIFCIFISWSSWTGNYEGGDIAAARKSYLGSSPIDIWGGFSGFFYGNLPSNPFNWGIYLLIVHMICTLTGLVLIRKEFYKEKSQLITTIYLFLSFVILSFVSFLTRDSTILSLLILGVGVLIKSFRFAKGSFRNLYVLSGILLLVAACAFRPWISISVALLVLALLKIMNADLTIIGKIFLFSIVTISPLLFDSLTYLNSAIRNVHPELQVIAMDAASFACYSNEDVTQSLGISILNEINGRNVDRNQVCANYHPNTWQSVAYWKMSKKDSLGLGKKHSIDLMQNEKVAIPTNMPKVNYDNTRKQWLKTITSEPKTYIQIKFSQLTQVMVAGDTIGLRYTSLANESVLPSLAKAIFLFPYDLIISLHIISPLMTLLLGFIFIIFSFRESRVKDVFGRIDLAFLFLFPLTWCVITAVAFIGDNGRYVYASSLLFLVLLPGFNSSFPHGRSVNIEK